MSLVCHTITSHYTAQEGDTVEKEVDKEEQDPWIAEKAFVNASWLHSKAAPAFVRATLECDQYGMPRMAQGNKSTQSTSTSSAAEDRLDVSKWYRNLIEGEQSSEQRIADGLAHAILKAETEPLDESYSENLKNVTSIVSNKNSRKVTPTMVRESSIANNWFTSRIPTHNSISTISKPSSTLADILSRNPPPLPSEPAFTPPVFLSIGPANRGFQMLQRKGWQEGEGLGTGRLEKRRVRAGLGANKVKEEENKSRSTLSSPNVIDLTSEDSSDVTSTMIVRAPEVVDLTLDSDSEFTAEDVDDELDGHYYKDQADALSPEPYDTPTTHGTALITPLPTTLKADRLGIGLKAGRRSNTKVKAITHTSAALAAHIRSANQTKKEKRRFGRGHRGLSRKNERNEKERVGMLKYLND